MDEFDQRPKSNEKNASPPVHVPIEALSGEVLAALIESFILREGTDYGPEEVHLQTKIKQVLQQLQSGKVKIVFDAATESVNLMTDHDWKKIHGFTANS